MTSATGNAATAAIAIGLTLTVVHLVGIPITGTSVNPARSLGPALVVGGTALGQVWLFIVAPLVGGVLAAGLHQLFYREEGVTLAPEAKQAHEAENPRLVTPPQRTSSAVRPVRGRRRRWRRG